MDDLDRRIEEGLKDGTVKLLDERTIGAPDPIEDRTNAAHERRDLVTQLKNYQPPAATWWTRSFVRAWLRWIIGLSEDVQKGELFERLVASNVQELSNLVKGLRLDLEATQAALLNTETESAEVKRRLIYYEHHNDSLRPTHARLRRYDEITAREQAEAQRRADRVRMREELRAKTQHGELIDCRECGGPGEVPDEKSKAKDAKKLCPTCNGAGVELNPDYVPLGEFKPIPKEKGDGGDKDEYKITRPRLVTDEAEAPKRLDGGDGGSAVSEKALPQGSGSDAPGTDG